jgi:hypothetical protein
MTGRDYLDQLVRDRDFFAYHLRQSRLWADPPFLTRLKQQVELHDAVIAQITAARYAVVSQFQCNKP